MRVSPPSTSYRDSQLVSVCAWPYRSWDVQAHTEEGILQALRASRSLRWIPEEHVGYDGERLLRHESGRS